MADIIFLNGTSSSGKSTISKKLKERSDVPFWHFASDQLVEAGMLPKQISGSGAFDWHINRPKFFEAFHQCIKSIADAGNNIILDHIIESDAWFEQLLSLLADHDVFYVGIHCPIEILRAREELRGDKQIGNRYLGEAEYHLNHVHRYGTYDFELDSSLQSPDESAEIIFEAWVRRNSKGYFDNHAN
jgi:chloramphenicol 3-O phosphotransferase